MQLSVSFFVQFITTDDSARITTLIQQLRKRTLETGQTGSLPKQTKSFSVQQGRSVKRKQASNAATQQPSDLEPVPSPSGPSTTQVRRLSRRHGAALRPGQGQGEVHPAGPPLRVRVGLLPPLRPGGRDWVAGHQPQGVPAGLTQYSPSDKPTKPKPRLLPFRRHI